MNDVRANALSIVALAEIAVALAEIGEAGGYFLHEEAQGAAALAAGAVGLGDEEQPAVAANLRVLVADALINGVRIAHDVDAGVDKVVKGNVLHAAAGRQAVGELPGQGDALPLDHGAKLGAQLVASLLDAVGDVHQAANADIVATHAGARGFGCADVGLGQVAEHAGRLVVLGEGHEAVATGQLRGGGGLRDGKADRHAGLLEGPGMYVDAAAVPELAVEVKGLRLGPATEDELDRLVHHGAGLAG